MVRFPLLQVSVILCYHHLGCRVQAFSSLLRPRLHSLLSTTTRSVYDEKSVIICKGSTDTDYDEWYADFDPSSFDNDVSTPSYSGSGNTRDRDSNNFARRSSYGRRDSHDYVRDTDADSSNVDEGAINALIAQRLQCRKTGRFEEADAIRDQLLDDHGVRVLDREKMWRSGCSRSGSGRQWGRSSSSTSSSPQRQQQQRQPRQQQQRRPSMRNFGPNGHDYFLSDDAGPNASPLSESDIHAQIASRLQCKMNRQFQQADSIQAELEGMGVYIHDGRKEWRADGQPYGDYQAGRGPGRTAGSISDRNRPYTQAPESEDTEFTEQIQALVDERSEAKKARSYQVADDIRDDLRNLYNVEVDDRLRLWSVNGRFGKGFDTRRGPPPFVRARWSKVPDNEAYVQELVDKRDAARKNRDFDTADSVLEELSSMDIEINDNRREWSFGKKETRAPKTFARRGGGALTPTEVDEISNLLVKRDEARANKQFGKADNIRDTLREKFLVRIDDRSREWMVVTDEFIMSPEVPIEEETKNLIESKIKERSVAKLNKEYETADAIRDELLENFSVHLDDRVNEWRIIEENPEDSFESDNDDFAAENEAEEISYGSTQNYETDIDDTVETGEENLESLKVDELKERLREAGLPVSGKKAELIERLSNA